MKSRKQVATADFTHGVGFDTLEPGMKKCELGPQTKSLPSEYGQLLADIKARVRSAQLAAFRAVNKELVALYWDIGKMIDSRQVAGARGDMVVKKLADDLQFEFPGVAGFSWRNLFYMSEFYVAYRDLPKLQPLVAIIGWSHQNYSAGDTHDTGKHPREFVHV